MRQLVIDTSVFSDWERSVVDCCLGLTERRSLKWWIGIHNHYLKGSITVRTCSTHSTASFTPPNQIRNKLIDNKLFQADRSLRASEWQWPTFGTFISSPRLKTLPIKPTKHPTERAGTVCLQSADRHVLMTTQLQADPRGILLMGLGGTGGTPCSMPSVHFSVAASVACSCASHCNPPVHSSRCCCSQNNEQITNDAQNQARRCGCCSCYVLTCVLLLRWST